MKKAILGGLLGGLALFVWGAISHMGLPLGEAGVRMMPPAAEVAVLAAMRSAILRRALLVTLLGLRETFDIDVSQWNWYSFPTAYLLAQLVDHTVGWFLAGLVLARVCRDRV
jgi:hypothetical protein